MTRKRKLRAKPPWPYTGTSRTPTPWERGLHCERLEDRRLMAVVTVDTELDVVDVNDVKTSLREAIFATNTVSGADEIRFDFGHDGPATILLTQGELKITDSLTITGSGAELLTIDASGNDSTPDSKDGNGTRIFSITLPRPFPPRSVSDEAEFAATPAKVVIAGVTLTGGDSSADGGAISANGLIEVSDSVIVANGARRGGGIFAGIATLTNSRLIGNTANQGGALFASGAIEVADCEILNNTALGLPFDDKGGGGIFVGRNALITNSRLEGNTAATSGGAVYVSGSTTIMGSEITGNEANGGGGIAGQAPIKIQQSKITRNSSHGDGGGVMSEFPMNLDLQGTLVAGNSAANDGGGVYVYGGQVSLSECEIDKNTSGGSGGGVWSRAQTTIDACTVAENLAQGSGGGIWLTSDNSIIRSSTISGNTSKNLGGGVYALSFETFNTQTVPISIVHSTIAFNSVEYDSTHFGAGGGIFVAAGRLAIDHSIIAKNQASIGADLTGFFEAVPEMRHSLLDRNAGSGFAPTGPGPDAMGNQVGEGSFSVGLGIDPKLGPLAYNGGRTRTHALLTGSSARDLGDASAIAGSDGVPLNDQRGTMFTRVFGGRIDLGAYEHQNFAEPQKYVVDLLADEIDDDYSAGQLSLREALGLANGNAGIVDSITLHPDLQGGVIQLRRHELRITDSVSIAGDAANSVTIDASIADPTPSVDNGDGIRVFHIDDGGNDGINVTIVGLTLTGGDVNEGGAILINREAVRLEQTILYDNSATRFGGAIWAETSQFVFSGGAISNNRAQWGGGAYLNGGDSDDVRIEFSHILGNAASAQGGGVYLEGRGSIVASSIFENVAPEGGGLRLLSPRVSRLGYAILVLNSTVYGNNASLDGGGIHTTVPINYGVLIARSTLSANTAARDGGGLFGESRQFIGNLFLVVQESTITDNTAHRDGGGVAANPGILSIYNSLLAGNHGATPDLFTGGYQQGELRFNLIGNASGTGLADTPPEGSDPNGNVIGVEDPKLEPLADNGGPTLTHALLATSPALGRGDPAYFPSAHVFGAIPSEFDQRGAPFARVAGERIDIGVYEFQAAGGLLSADFDGDGNADGADFLTWQRNLGSQSAAAHERGDATLDDDVDGHDLAVWQSRFGMTTSEITTVQTAAFLAAAPLALTGLISSAETSDDRSLPRTKDEAFAASVEWRILTAPRLAGDADYARSRSSAATQLIPRTAADDENEFSVEALSEVFAW